MSNQICESIKAVKQLLFEKNLEKGRIAEIIAKEDYENHGFHVTKTGIGSDFLAEKQIPGHSEPYQEFVEVKAGHSILSKRQKISKRAAKRQGINYTEYIVSDDFLENYLKENTIPQVLNNELLELIPDNWEQNSNYKIIIPGICPHCGLTVDALNDVITKFGLRRMQDGTIRNQSWCRKCRSQYRISGGRFYV